MTETVVFNNFPKIAGFITTAIKQTVKKTAMDIQAVAAINAPKDTGFLASSIYTVTGTQSGYGKTTTISNTGKRRHKKLDTTSLLPEIPPPPDAYTAYVVVGASYGIYVEMGTRFMAAQPYFYPAVDFVQPLFEAELSKIANMLGSESGVSISGDIS
jgi:hypothetical protein